MGLADFSFHISLHGPVTVHVSQQSKYSLAIAAMQFAPIQYPASWPPPDVPPYSNHWSSRIPVVGYVSRYIKWRQQWRTHLTNVLEPIADDIIEQLTDRPNELMWPEHEPRRSIAQIVSDAVGLEKGLPQSPALHPDDPFQPMFWGPFDDLTPLIVRMECRDKLDVSLPENIFIDAWNQRWTIKQFIETAALNLPAAVKTAG